MRSTDGLGLYVEKAFSIGIDEIPMTLNATEVNDLDFNYSTGVYVSAMGRILSNFKSATAYINNLQKGVTFSIKHAYRNGDTSNDVQGKFRIMSDGLPSFDARSIFKPSLSELGYYQLVITASNGKGSNLDIPLNVNLMSIAVTEGGTVDASAVRHDIKMATEVNPNKARILKTGSGDDILEVNVNGIAGSAVNGGTGDNTYRFANDSSNNYSVHGFDSGDKIQVKTTWVSLSVYDNESDVVAGAGNRYIYVKATGKLYRDKGGDAAWNGTNIDLKTGATNENKLVTVLYSDEGTTFYQDMKASQLEYKDF